MPARACSSCTQHQRLRILMVSTCTLTIRMPAAPCFVEDLIFFLPYQYEVQVAGRGLNAGTATGQAGMANKWLSAACTQAAHT